jgi:hypothetical protein
MHSVRRLNIFTCPWPNVGLMHIPTTSNNRIILHIWKSVTTNTAWILKRRDGSSDFNSPRKFSQKSYIFISTNFSFRESYKICHGLSFYISKVPFCFALWMEVTVAASWKDLQPLCNCKSSFRTVRVNFYGINKYPNRENELSKSGSSFNVYIF